MPAHRKNSQAEAMYELYQQGSSLAEVGNQFGVTRQSVYIVFSRRGWPMRTRTPKPAVTFNGDTYAPDPVGYWRKTYGDRNWMHHAVWEASNGPIPAGMHIHHIDHDKANNSLENLELLSPSEHSKHHQQLQPVPAKACLHCGATLVRRRFPNGQLEVPAAVTRRKFCGPGCHGQFMRGKPRGAKAEAA